MTEYSNEIIGFLIKGTIYSGFQSIDAAKYNGNNVDQIITRDMARFMAAADLGHQWNKLQNAPTILIKDDNSYRLPNGYYTNRDQEIFEIKDGIKHILENAALITDKN